MSTLKNISGETLTLTGIPQVEAGATFVVTDEATIESLTLHGTAQLIEDAPKGGKTKSFKAVE